MTVDILLSTYNGENYLKDQLDSLLTQTYTNWFAYIRDDGSNDNSIGIVTEYVKLYPEKFALIENKGINLGSSKSFLYLLTQSCSNLICFCDQDDVWNENKLQVMVEYYQSINNKNVPVLIHSDVLVVDSSLNSLEEETIYFNKHKCGMERKIAWQIFQNDVTGCTVMVNNKMRELIQQVDINSLKIIQHDWFLALVAYLYNTKFYIKEKLILYRQHEKNSIGVNRLSLIEKIKSKISKGISYPYYDQVECVLKLVTTLDENHILKDFISIQKKNKVYRIFWHIKNKFYKDGSIMYKIYQLISC